MITINPQEKQVTLLNVLDLKYSPEAKRIQIGSKMISNQIRSRIPVSLQNPAQQAIDNLSDILSDKLGDVIANILKRMSK